MIKQFSDLSANERTYLAWIRTAIAMMTFGFLVEKFELFLRTITAEVHVGEKIQTSVTIETVGIVTMIISVIMMLAATARYLTQRRNILLEAEIGSASDTIGLLLSIFMILISLFLIGYIWLRLFY